MIEQVGFGLIGLVLVFSATRVVTSENLVRSVLWLALTLCATAVLFLMLSAPFMASIQLLLYTGGVITLMLFGVMLTNRETGVVITNERSSSARAGLLAAAVFGVFAAALYRSRDALPVRPADAVEMSTAVLGRSFLTEHVLAFEVLSILLLAAMIGAIVLARRHDFGEESPSRVERVSSSPSESSSEPESKTREEE